MSLDQLPVVLILAALVGLVAVALILRRREAEAPAESPFTASSEGQKVCPSCGMANVWTASRCISCQRHLADARKPEQAA